MKTCPWYWKPWFFETGLPDLSIVSVKTIEKGTKITIEKKSGPPVPLYLTVTFQDGSTQLFQQTARIWKDKNIFVLDKKFTKPVKSVHVGNFYIPEGYFADNTFDIK